MEKVISVKKELVDVASKPIAEVNGFFGLNADEDVTYITYTDEHQKDNVVAEGFRNIKIIENDDGTEKQEIISDEEFNNLSKALSGVKETELVENKEDEEPEEVEETEEEEKEEDGQEEETEDEKVEESSEEPKESSEEPKDEEKKTEVEETSEEKEEEQSEEKENGKEN